MLSYGVLTNCMFAQTGHQVLAVFVNSWRLNVPRRGRLVAFYCDCI